MKPVSTRISKSKSTWSAQRWSFCITATYASNHEYLCFQSQLFDCESVSLQFSVTDVAGCICILVVGIQLNRAPSRAPNCQRGQNCSWAEPYDDPMTSIMCILHLIENQIEKPFPLPFAFFFAPVAFLRLRTASTLPSSASCF